MRARLGARQAGRWQRVGAGVAAGAAVLMLLTLAGGGGESPLGGRWAEADSTPVTLPPLPPSAERGAPVIPVKLRRARDGRGKTCAWLSPEFEADAIELLAKRQRKAGCAALFETYRAARRAELLRRRVPDPSLAAFGAPPAPIGGAPSVEPPMLVANWTSGSGEAIGSGSVARCPESGVLLYSFDRWTSRAGTDVYVSADEGATWTRGLRADDVKWATVFVAGADVYLLGVRKYFWYTKGKSNPVVITRMERGSRGTRWSPVVDVTPDLRVHMANGAVSVSRGVVHVSFTHDMPQSPLVPPAATAEKLTVTDAQLDAAQLRLQLRSEKAAAAVPLYSLVSLTEGAEPTREKQLGAARVLFLRVLGRDGAALLVRAERWDKARDAGKPVKNRISFALPVNRPSRGPWTFAAGSYVRPLMVTFGDMQWGMIRARAGDDLLRPEAWRLVRGGMSNPAMAFPTEWGEQLSITPVLGRRAGQPVNCGLNIGRNECPYWQESVSVRNEHADPSRLTVGLRMTNDMVCDLSLMVDVRSETAVADDDAGGGGAFEGSFARAGHLPGMSVVRSHFVWDEGSQLYWSVGNAAHNIKPGRNLPGQWPRCTWDRSTLMLHYSTNLVNWFEATVVAMAVEHGRHYSYGFAMVDGNDLLISAHSNPDGLPGPKSANLLVASHNSPYATLHRVRNFRGFANPLLVYRAPVAH